MKGTNIYILYTHRRNWYAYYIIYRYPPDGARVMCIDQARMTIVHRVLCT